MTNMQPIHTRAEDKLQRRCLQAAKIDRIPNAFEKRSTQLWEDSGLISDKYTVN